MLDDDLESSVIMLKRLVATAAPGLLVPMILGDLIQLGHPIFVNLIIR